MTSRAISAKLEKLGFAYDESVTSKGVYWGGVIDPIGKTSICGECRGVPVSGNTRAEMDLDALREAEELSQFLEPCTDPNCEIHGEEEEEGD